MCINEMVLCVLGYLGRGWRICDLNESFVINKEMIWLFISRFIDFGSSELFQKFVVEPRNIEQLDDYNYEFKLASVPGCICCTDATHIVTEHYIYLLQQLHLGYKKEHTSRTYNLTVNHRCQIFITTSGHPAWFTDQTLICYDRFVTALKKEWFASDFTFDLCNYDAATNDVIEVVYNDYYLTVDNGYLKWSVTMSPMKHTNFRNEIRFSEQIESMRKDVKCYFGILKGNWRIWGVVSNYGDYKMQIKYG